MVSWLASATLLALAAWFVAARWDEVRRAGGLPGVGAVLLAAVLHLVGNAVAATTWRELARVAGDRLRWGTAAWIWSASQLARYGLSGAQVAGRAVLARRYGASALAGGVTALVETAWQTAIIGVLLLSTLPWWLPGTAGLTWLVVAAAVPVAVLVLGTVAPMRLLRLAADVAGWRPVRRLTGGRLATGLAGVTLGRGEAARLTVLFAATTTLRLGAFAVLLAAVGGRLPADLGVAVGAYAVGQLAGRLAVFAPGGLGAQEGAAAVVLAPVLGGPVALLLVAAMRLAEVVGELGFLLLARRAAPVRRSSTAR